MIDKRRLCVALIAASLTALAAAPAASQTYPSRPIKIIVPFAPGGVDVLARLVGDRIGASLGQPIIVETRPGGAGGSIGAKAAATAEPDGYTLFFTTPGPLTISGAVNKNLDFDPVKSFTPIAMVSESALLLVVTPNFPAKTIPDLIAYAKANPGKISFASPGYGTQPHLLGEMLKLETGTDLVHVPYRGSAPAITDLVSGQVQMYFDNTANLMPFVDTGRVVPIAVTSEGRHPLLPKVPTMLEEGVKGFVVTYWNGVLAPVGTPEGVIVKLNAAINDGVKTPELQAYLAKNATEARLGSPQNFAAHIAAEAKKWADLAKAASIKVE